MQPVGMHMSRNSLVTWPGLASILLLQPVFCLFFLFSRFDEARMESSSHELCLLSLKTPPLSDRRRLIFFDVNRSSCVIQCIMCSAAPDFALSGINATNEEK
ncbi:hypothetical protein O181_036688 [Austropuccinia psidii MF-1]|uniref:Uncharacterized protein n=1 Tax=Austropuccinia psidii MF-1 TaxID=1389203 RepID=A0A9Q3H9F0_9BASI|nr:hypothetical protein [Austropuccinia psidii MF-1]